MNDWLLTDEEIGDLLDLESDYTYPCSDGSKTMTIDCRQVVQAQLRKVVEYGYENCNEHTHSTPMPRFRVACKECRQSLHKEAGMEVENGSIEALSG